jgi:hypothetical protein
VYKKVILTKDNLAKRYWNGCTKCVFCGSHETIDHLFITCPFSRLVWRIVYFTYNIPPPSNVTNVFGNWLNVVDKKTKARIRVGLCALIWDFGQFGIDEMMWFLTELPNQISCRLSTELLYQFTCSPTSFIWSSESLWILDAIG